MSDVWWTVLYISFVMLGGGVALYQERKALAKMWHNRRRRE